MRDVQYLSTSAHHIYFSFNIWDLVSLKKINSEMHYANLSVQYTALFHGCKTDNFQMKFFDIFLIFAQNIDCGYSLEPRGGSNEYPHSMF